MQTNMRRVGMRACQVQNSKFPESKTRAACRFRCVLPSRFSSSCALGACPSYRHAPCRLGCGGGWLPCARYVRRTRDSMNRGSVVDRVGGFVRLDLLISFCSQLGFTSASIGFVGQSSVPEKDAEGFFVFGGMV